MNHNSRKSRIKNINKYAIALNNPTVFQFIHYFFGSNISQAPYSLLFLIITLVSTTFKMIWITQDVLFLRSLIGKTLFFQIKSHLQGSEVGMWAYF